MKIKALTRSSSSVQTPGSDVARQPRNLDPALHPFERAREYTRALNATKLERMFAAPFVDQLGKGHVDGVYTLARDPSCLERFASASGDGVVKVWDLPSRDEKWQTQAHNNLVKGICWTQDQKLLSCGTDRFVKLWDPYNTPGGSKPVATWTGSNAFSSVTLHRHEPAFAVAASSTVQIFDLSRASATPTQNLAWPNSVDTINDLKFNQSETSILASCANDRSLVFYDLRTSSPLFRGTLKMAGNSIAWNPVEPFNLAVGCEDHDIYYFDARMMDGELTKRRALNVLKDHVSAVMCVDWSPTGQELVSASYDRSIRLWTPHTSGRSREPYHTKRMQRVFSCLFTGDSKYVLSGSDDGNIRLWRANASERNGIKSARERQKLEYDQALKEKWKHMPEIKRIARHRHLPKVVKKATEIKNEELKAIKRREENERKHSRQGQKKRRSEREKAMVAVEQ
jgi:WD repeat and SOF domain-containing protein 1